MVLLSVLLSLVLHPAPALQDFNPHEVVYRNFSLSKLAGYWNSISVASNNLSRIQPHGDLRFYMQSLESLQNGSLQLNVHFRLLGVCERITMLLQRTDHDGVFTIDYEGESKVFILETDYHYYSTFHLRNIKGGVETSLLALYVVVATLPQHLPLSSRGRLRDA
ncbi:epididymal-specific lipocalin-9 [Tenrec ecaudatus]|uniref:epididymal-specific lipocalin-9 n=1 Tax=Tenrec ecaudatus TaxID=94439 RepID=UPI003F5991A2